MKYSDKTLAYYNNLQNIGSLDDKDSNVGTGIVGSPLCGDVMKLQILFDKSGIITHAKYKVFGCVSAIASMELTCKLLKGKTIDEAMKIKNEEVASLLELSDIKKHCSVLAKESIVSAIDNYLSKKSGEIKKMITISDNALKKLKELISSNEQKCVGIGIVVLQGGCSGIDYSLAYETEEESLGKKYEEIEDLKFFYKESDFVLIDGLVIDIINNSFGEGFSLTNKNQFSCENCTCKCS